MLFTGMQEQIVELSWDFYLPVMLFVCLIALAVPAAVRGQKGIFNR